MGACSGTSSSVSAPTVTTSAGWDLGMSVVTLRLAFFTMAAAWLPPRVLVADVNQTFQKIDLHHNRKEVSTRFMVHRCCPEQCPAQCSCVD